MYKKNTVALVLQVYYSCYVCLNMNDLAQLKCKKLGCVFQASADIIIAFPQLYSTSEICYQGTRTVKVTAGYQHCQTNSRAPRV